MEIDLSELHLRLEIDRADVTGIQFSAKIAGDNGQLLGARIFQTSGPASIADEASVAASLNNAFGKAVTELVVGTRKTI